MDNLPPPVQLEILNRLNESADLARCRMASKTLNALSFEVRTLNIFCSFQRWYKSRAPETKSQMTPFKLIVEKLLLSSKNLESISIGVEKPWGDASDEVFTDDFSNRYEDDLYLSDVDFVSGWLPKIAGRLKSITIGDYWPQSSSRKSKILSLISSCCNHLVELDMGSACLSVEGLKPMLMLTNLTLEFVKLDDKDLNKVNECFPFLQVLNLIVVGGLREPKVNLLHLKTCKWYAFKDPFSLTINTPNLVELDLRCVKPRSLILKAPLLSTLHLSIEKASKVFEVEKFLSLKYLHIESSDLSNLIKLFPECKTVEDLELDSPKWVELGSVLRENVNFEKLMSAFPNVSCLVLRPGAWSELETCFLVGGLEARNGWKTLKQLVAHLVVYELETTRSFISSISEQCTSLSDMTMLVHRDIACNVRNHLIISCMGDCPRIRWRWGMWKEEEKDTWICDGMCSYNAAYQ
ncbi:hypothetical protein BVC80_41g46 [Macleaya cordata]|uniref:F-box domain n=1 Tax=Macleaya cordata TaxID=56857 RepID=A0A200QMQ5_MACCD|nr:hypothetical protein BVC80_41g46 [Macleaya cordata]